MAINSEAPLKAENTWKYAVQREASCVWLTVFEGDNSAAVMLSYDEAAMLGSLILPDGGDYLNRNTTLGASYEVSIPTGFENLPHDLLAAELSKSEKYARLTAVGIDAGVLDGGLVHDAHSAVVLSTQQRRCGARDDDLQLHGGSAGGGIAETPNVQANRPIAAGWCLG